MSSPLDEVPSDEDVRVHVTRAALARVPEEFPTGGSYVTGRIVAMAADSVVIRVPVTRRTEAIGMPALRQDLYIHRAEIVDVERREVSGLRTGLAVAAATGAAAALVALIIEASGGPDDVLGEPPDQLRLPLVVVPGP
jgi:hypothetical protein